MMKLAKTCFIAAVAAGATLSATAESAEGANAENCVAKDAMERPFKNYRFCVDSTKEPTDCMQLSEFELYGADGKLISPGKFELDFDGSGGDDDFGDGEKPECAVDGNLDTKWLDFRASHGGNAARRSAVWIQFKFAEPTKLSGYRWYTANDDEDRDPRDWRLLGSNDGVNWVVVDKVEDFEATSDRRELAYSARFGSVALVKTSTPEGWLDDYDAALKKAAAENKYVLADFSGSDWCYWCKRLDKEVFATDAFRKGAADKYVLLMVDTPLDKSLLTPKAAKENKKLAEKFNIHGFPTVIVLDSKGEEVLRTGYQDGGPENYLKMLEDEIRIAPEVKKYIKPIKDVLSRTEELLDNEIKAANEKLKMVLNEEVYPKHLPLFEKSIAEVKAMNVPEDLEERKKDLIEDAERQCDRMREEMEDYAEEKSNK